MPLPPPPPKICREIHFSSQTGTFSEYLCTFMTISRWIILIIRNVSDKICWGNQNKHFISSNISSKIVPFMRKCRKIWRSQGGRTTWRMRVVCRKTKATQTHTDWGYVLRTFCFSTATMVTPTRLDVTWYVHCLIFNRIPTLSAFRGPPQVCLYSVTVTTPVIGILSGYVWLVMLCTNTPTPDASDVSNYAQTIGLHQTDL
jgi:hypothetical protein